MMTQEVNFSHRYHKFDAAPDARGKRMITTIRSINYGLERGDIVNVSINHQHEGVFRVVWYEDKPIRDFGLEVLKTDGEYPGFNITSHQDFVTLLNSFTRFAPNRLSTVKRIYHLEEVTIL